MNQEYPFQLLLPFNKVDVTNCVLLWFVTDKKKGKRERGGKKNRQGSAIYVRRFRCGVP